MPQKLFIYDVKGKECSKKPGSIIAFSTNLLPKPVLGCCAIIASIYREDVKIGQTVDLAIGDPIHVGKATLISCSPDDLPEEIKNNCHDYDYNSYWTRQLPDGSLLYADKYFTALAEKVIS